MATNMVHELFGKLSIVRGDAGQYIPKKVQNTKALQKTVMSSSLIVQFSTVDILG